MSDGPGQAQEQDRPEDAEQAGLDHAEEGPDLGAVRLPDHGHVRGREVIEGGHRAIAPGRIACAHFGAYPARVRGSVVSAGAGTELHPFGRARSEREGVVVHEGRRVIGHGACVSEGVIHSLKTVQVSDRTQEAHVVSGSKICKTKKARATLARDYVLLDNEQQVIQALRVWRSFACLRSDLAARSRFYFLDRESMRES